MQNSSSYPDSMQFIVNLSLADTNDSDEYISPLIPGPTLLVRAQRPNLLRIESIKPDPNAPLPKIATILPFDLFISDGQQQIEMMTMISNDHVIGPCATDLTQIKGVKGIPRFIFPEIVFDPTWYHQYSYSRKFSVREKICVVYTKDLYNKGRYRVIVTAEENTMLPVSISMIVLYPALHRSTPRKIEVWRAEYSDWIINPTFSDTIFDTSPPVRPLLPLLEIAPRTQLSIGDVAPLFRVTDLLDNEISSERFQGKILLIFFWATWCSACEDQALWIRWLNVELRSKFQVLGVSLDTDISKAELLKFARQHSMNWKNICDFCGADGPIAIDFGVASLPYNILIGRNGNILAINAPYEEAKSIIKKRTT